MALAESVLRDDEALIAEVPVEYRDQFSTSRIGSIIMSDQRALFLYLLDGSWSEFAEYQLSVQPLAQYRGNELNTVFIPMPDGNRVSELRTEYISKIEEITGTSYFTDILEEENSKPEVEPDDCSCNRISSNKVLVENENLELGENFDEEEFRLVSCKDCYEIYGRYRQGKKASLNKLFSADWLLGGNSAAESIVELGNDEAYAIHHSPNGSLRVQDAILTLSHIANRSDDIASTYKHQYQHALCYILGDEMVAYLSWENHERRPIQSQLYVRDDQRGKGIAATLVSEWYEKVCQSEQYFADDLTPGGRAVLTSIDHLDTGSAPAQEVYSLTPMAFG